MHLFFPLLLRRSPRNSDGLGLCSLLPTLRSPPAFLPHYPAGLARAALTMTANTEDVKGYGGLTPTESRACLHRFPRTSALGIRGNRMVDRPRVVAAPSGYRKRRLRKV